MDTIDVNLKKKKRRKLFTNIAIASALSFAFFGVCFAFIYNNDYQISKAVEYDDEGYEITLSVDEVQDYALNHLFDELSDNSFSVITISYNDNTYSYVQPTPAGYVNNINYFEFTNKNSLDSDHYLIYTEMGTEITIEYDVNIIVTSEYYDDIKSAIELDIQDNQPYTNNTFLQDIIELLVGGIGVTASGIGVGLSTLVSNLVIQNNAMSPFIAIVLIFGGIALAFALSRWAINLISSLGQRNR